MASEIGLIDLHCHLLPGVDDGSADLDHSLALAEEAVANGVTHAVVTPHHLNGRYVNHRLAVEKGTEEFKKALAEAGIPLTIFAGQEVRVSDRVLPALRENDLLCLDGSGRYLLLEWPSQQIPVFFKQLVFELLQVGITPVIAHPERNQGVIDQPTRLAEFLEMGCLTQLTASSYLGTFGKTVAKTCEQLVAAGQGTIFASDAHAMKNRDYELAEAYEKLVKDQDAMLADTYRQRARDIINGETVTMNWRPVKIRKKFLGLF